MPSAPCCRACAPSAQRCIVTRAARRRSSEAQEKAPRDDLGRGGSLLAALHVRAGADADLRILAAEDAEGLRIVAQPVSYRQQLARPQVDQVRVLWPTAGHSVHQRPVGACLHALPAASLSPAILVADAAALARDVPSWLLPPRPFIDGALFRRGRVGAVHAGQGATAAAPGTAGARRSRRARAGAGRLLPAAARHGEHERLLREPDGRGGLPATPQSGGSGGSVL